MLPSLISCIYKSPNALYIVNSWRIVILVLEIIFKVNSILVYFV